MQTCLHCQQKIKWYQKTSISQPHICDEPNCKILSTRIFRLYGISDSSFMKGWRLCENHALRFKKLYKKYHTAMTGPEKNYGAGPTSRWARRYHEDCIRKAYDNLMDYQLAIAGPGYGDI